MNVKTFNIKMEIGNDALATSQDVAAVIRKTAKKIEDYKETDHPGIILDDNGNRIGKYWYSYEQPIEYEPPKRKRPGKTIP
jgi:hypothetical protein